jgi:tetratricopeptide (TPR) repeat protein
MKWIFFFITLPLFFSCSGKHIKRDIKDPSWDAFSNESFMRMDQHRLLKAIAHKDNRGCYVGVFKKTLEKFKDDYGKEKNESYWPDIGTCFFLNGEFEKAEFYYRLVISETKNNLIKSMTLNNLGLIYLHFGLWEKAHDYFNQAITTAPAFRVPRFNLALLYLQFGLYEKTISIFTSNHFTRLKDVDIYLNLASAYLFSGDLVKAEEVFKLIPTESYKREDLAGVYALFLVEKGNMVEASKILEQREKSDVAPFHIMTQKIEKLIALKLHKD